MSPLFEALALPCLLLTVVLAGAIRPGADVTMVPPTLGSLVVAIALMALLVRSGALAPERLMGPSRSPLQNLNGLTALLALYAASAQVITLVVPDSGVPALIGWVVLVSLLLQAFAVAPDRARLLRGLAVTFAAAFVLKFVVLAAISSPTQGRLARGLQLLFEGVTLGAVSQRPAHPLEGYLAFGTLVLYLVGLACLPRAAWHMVRAHLASAYELRSRN
ncbi:MAG TPA: hypothetical protein VMS86_01305 [Thermoanaerobaculia bacterium]|nr:hypothetical protein [Thermoanaerobaculia bacterium]